MRKYLIGISILAAAIVLAADASIFAQGRAITTTGVVYIRRMMTPLLFADGTAAAPSVTFTSVTGTGIYNDAANSGIGFSVGGSEKFLVNANGDYFNGSLNVAAAGVIGFTSGAFTNALDTILARDAANILALKNGTNAQTFRQYAYTSGSRAAYSGFTCTAQAVTLSGATTLTSGLIPAGAVVEQIATTTTTAITGATGYQVGDGSAPTRYGDITGTIVGTASGSANYTADPRWWTNGAREITLTAKTSNFTGGVVQVMACYRTATGA